MCSSSEKGNVGKSSGTEFFQVSSDRPDRSKRVRKSLQLCHSSGKVKVDKTRITDKGIVAEGIVALKILYIIGNDEMPFYSMDAMLPFTHLIEAEEIGKDCTYLLQADLEQLSTAMADGDEIEVKAAVGLNVLVFRQWEEQLIESVEEQPLDRKENWKVCRGNLRYIL